MQTHRPTAYQRKRIQIELPVGAIQSHAVDFKGLANELESVLTGAAWTSGNGLTVTESAISGQTASATLQASQCGHWLLDVKGGFADGQIRIQQFEVRATGT